MKVSSEKGGGENSSLRSTAYIGLGGNEGDVEAAFTSALAILDARFDTSLKAVSSRIRTRPEGPVADQPDFLNAAAELRTNLDPALLMKVMLKIEAEFGRDRAVEIPGGPRPLDLDLLLFAGRVINEPDLVLPHPRMHLRRFVLAPLAEIAPDAVHPLLRKTVSQLLVELR